MPALCRATIPQTPRSSGPRGKGAPLRNNRPNVTLPKEVLEKMRGLRGFIIGWVIVFMLAAFNHWLFTTWFGITYLDWYLKNGALIGLVTAGVALTWGDMNKHTGLISAHPLVYLGACLQLVGIPLFVMGTHLRSNPDNRKPRSLFDALVTVLLVLIPTVVMLVWLVVVAPLQFFVYLICGGPAGVFFPYEPRAAGSL